MTTHCDCWPGAPCTGHPSTDTAADMVRHYLREPNTVPSQEIVDPADLWVYAGATTAEQRSELALELAVQLAGWHQSECQACLDWEQTAWHDETRQECAGCHLTGWISDPVPRIVWRDGELVCPRCFLVVGEHDSVCPRGHELIVEHGGLSLETALRLSTEDAANDVEGGAA